MIYIYIYICAGCINLNKIFGWVWRRGVPKVPTHVTDLRALPGRWQRIVLHQYVHRDIAFTSVYFCVLFLCGWSQGYLWFRQGFFQGWFRVSWELVQDCFRVYQGRCRVVAGLVQGFWFSAIVGFCQGFLQGLFWVYLVFLVCFFGLIEGLFRFCLRLSQGIGRGCEGWLRVSVGFVLGFIQFWFRIYSDLVQVLFRAGLGLMQGFIKVSFRV